jgi:hypothetical protein
MREILTPLSPSLQQREGEGMFLEEGHRSLKLPQKITNYIGVKDGKQRKKECEKAQADKGAERGWEKEEIVEWGCLRGAKPL